MTAIMSALARGEYKSLFGALSRTAGSPTGTSTDVRDYEGVAAVILDAAAAGGGTADYSIQESADGSTGWAAVPVAEITGGAFTQVTTGGASVQIRYIDLTQRKAFVRAAATIATGPSVACFGLVAQKKYQS